MNEFIILRAARSSVAAQHDRGGVRPRFVVVIPVRNEEARIGVCLSALADQRQLDGSLLSNDAYQVVLVLNGCTDRTWQRVAEQMASTRLSLEMIECKLPAAENHAGGARALACRYGLSRVGVTAAIVLTTDADSRVPADWIARAASTLAAGCDAVAGPVEVHPEELTALPTSLRQRQRLEQTYADLLDEIDARYDPRPHNPWPSHRVCSGANLAFRAEALRRVQPLPRPPCGEDRALIAALERHDFRVRHDPVWRVRTSGRLEGRAAAGMADTLRDRSEHPDAPCDERLERAHMARRRAVWRARARDLHTTGRLHGIDAWRSEFMLAPPTLHDAPALRHFGGIWEWLERHAADLHRVLLHPVDLPEEIVRARCILDAKRALDRVATEVAA